METLNNKIIWGGDVTEGLAIEFVKNFLYLEGKFDSLEIICTGSNGGDFDTACCAMMDVILKSTKHVTTVAMGLAASSAGLIFLCGDERVMYPRSLLMFHHGSVGFEANSTEIPKLADIIAKQQEMDFELLTEKSNRPPSYWKETLQKGDYYVFPEEALKLELATKLA